MFNATQTSWLKGQAVWKQLNAGNVKWFDTCNRQCVRENSRIIDSEINVPRYSAHSQSSTLVIRSLELPKTLS